MDYRASDGLSATIELFGLVRSRILGGTMGPKLGVNIELTSSSRDYMQCGAPTLQLIIAYSRSESYIFEYIYDLYFRLSVLTVLAMIFRLSVIVIQ
ncbi:hypothetical protein HAX54_023918, partial [Datura stramonium]|nr:hypothetical protein [Datura stramonium]